MPLLYLYFTPLNWIKYFFQRLYNRNFLQVYTLKIFEWSSLEAHSIRVELFSLEASSEISSDDHSNVHSKASSVTSLEGFEWFFTRGSSDHNSNARVNAMIGIVFFFVVFEWSSLDLRVSTTRSSHLQVNFCFFVEFFSCQLTSYNYENIIRIITF